MASGLTAGTGATIVYVIDVIGSTIPGLRERKKLRTRGTLIDVAAELCVRQGYEQTTVEQIAAAADVSSRTFSRYFPTKGAVIVAAVDEVSRYVAEALAVQPYDITELEALLRAHLLTFLPDDPNSPEALSFNRVAMLIQIVNSSPTLGVGTYSFRQRGAQSPTVVVLAQRMGLPVDDAAVRLVADTWTILMATACRGLGTAGNEPIEAAIVCDRVKATYAIFARLWRPWNPDGRPPAGAPSH